MAAEIMRALLVLHAASSLYACTGTCLALDLLHGTAYKISMRETNTLEQGRPTRTNIVYHTWYNRVARGKAVDISIASLSAAPQRTVISNSDKRVRHRRRFLIESTSLFNLLSHFKQLKPYRDPCIFNIFIIFVIFIIV